jgi:nitrate reductase beta subunit
MPEICPHCVGASLLAALPLWAIFKHKLKDLKERLKCWLY